MSTTYKKNFLNKVIFRLDFPKNIAIGQLTDYSKVAKKYLSVKEQKEGMSGFLDVNMLSGEVNHSSEKINAWTFHNKENTKILEVGINYIYVEYKKYKNSKELLDDIINLILPFLDFYKVDVASRIGLRYTNEISLNKEKDPLDWKNYIQGNLIGSLKFADDNKMNISRSMGQIITKEELGSITFNYGVWNKDFPNQVMQKEFVLDYDCFSKLGIAKDEVLDRAKKYNEYIETLFEASITNDFRQLLNK